MTPRPHWFAGLGVCAWIACFALSVSVALGGHWISVVPAACLLLGLVARLMMPSRQQSWAPGVDVARKYVLRTAIVLIGLQVSLQDFARAGWPVLVVDLFMVSTTIALAMWLGRRFGLDPLLSLLIGAGAGVCGTSAVMSTQQATGASSATASVAVATVVAGGLLCLFLYPVLWSANLQLGVFSASGFGLFVGSTVHEVAQVIALTSQLGAPIAQPALIAKMGRVALLAPMLAILVIRARRGGEGTPLPTGLHPIRSAAMFPLLFVAAIACGTVAPLPQGVLGVINVVALGLISVALAGTGMATGVEAVRHVGRKAFSLAAVLFAWLVVGGALANVLVARLF